MGEILLYSLTTSMNRSACSHQTGSQWSAMDYKRSSSGVFGINAQLTAFTVSFCHYLSGGKALGCFKRGKKKTITKRQRGPSIKEVRACDVGSVMWSTSFVTGKGKQRGKTIAHLSQTHEKNNSSKTWSIEVTCCHNSLFGRGNSIFSLLRACPAELATVS